MSEQKQPCLKRSEDEKMSNNILRFIIISYLSAILEWTEKISCIAQFSLKYYSFHDI